MLFVGLCLFKTNSKFSLISILFIAGYANFDLLQNQQPSADRQKSLLQVIRLATSTDVPNMVQILPQGDLPCKLLLLLPN